MASQGLPRPNPYGKEADITPDVTELRKAIQNFSYKAKPSNGNDVSPCTVADLEKAVKEMTKVLNAFADKLEEIE